MTTDNNGEDSGADNKSSNISDTEHSFDAIEAAEITLTQPQNLSAKPTAIPNDPTHRATQKQIWLYGMATASLLLVALGVIIFNQSEKPAEHQINQASENKSAASNSAQNDIAANDAPFHQQQVADARRAAQDVLARIIELKKILESVRVSEWARQDFEAALAASAQGDVLYQKHQFGPAQQKYQLSEQLLIAIEARVEPFIKESLSEGLAAISAGNTAQAKAAFERVLIIDDDHPAAQTGLKRVARLPEVLSLTEQANIDLDNARPAEALALYEQALLLDANFKPAILGADKAKTQLAQDNFQAAIDQGYANMQQSNFAGAIQSFRQALAIKPGSQAASDGLALAKNEKAQQLIQVQLANTQNYEQQEQWHQALTTYEQILARDNSIIEARVGKIRSQTRATLDDDLQKIITEPLRLVSTNIYEHAQTLLVDAQNISPGGHRLTQQINQIKQILIDASTPVAVTLQSDNATTVSLLRVGTLGQFSSKVVTLKPGKYIIEGVRPGYRDVRVNLMVNPERGQPPVLVACREAI